ncbi:hypothetical protein CAOG_08594, partial [Capsaspora owczarzaki ATCC 30864]
MLQGKEDFVAFERSLVQQVDALRRVRQRYMALLGVLLLWHLFNVYRWWTAVVPAANDDPSRPPASSAQTDDAATAGLHGALDEAARLQLISTDEPNQHYFSNFLFGEPNLLFSWISLIVFFLTGSYQNKINAPHILITRVKRALRTFDLTCDSNGKLILPNRFRSKGRNASHNSYRTVVGTPSSAFSSSSHMNVAGTSDNLPASLVSTSEPTQVAAALRTQLAHGNAIDDSFFKPPAPVTTTVLPPDAVLRSTRASQQ